MQVDLGHVEGRNTFEFHESFGLFETELGDYGCDASVTAAVTSMGNRYLLEAKVGCRVRGRCDRCLEDCALRIDTQVDMVFQREGFSGEIPSGAGENDFVVLTSEEEYCYNIFPRVMEAVVLEIPIKILCSEDCRGLCPVCGANLNKEECRCEKETGDPRWEPLKKIFNSNS